MSEKFNIPKREFIMSEIFNIPKRNEGYKYVFKEDTDFTCIGIKGGQFEGVIYKYGEITLSDDENPDGTLPFRFQYDILDNNGVAKENFNDNFFTLIGDILVDIIDREEYRAKSNN